MFTAVEMDYVTGLVEQMRNQGYLYYVARTVTENGNNFDIDCVFSKTEITADGLYRYQVTDGVRYVVDSSGYTIGSGNYNTYNGPRSVVTEFSGVYSFADTEFVYSNATFSGGTVAPDLRLRGGGQVETNTAVLWVGCLSVLMLFFALLFRR